MRALVYDRFGSPEVLDIRDLPEPPARPGRVRVRVEATALNPKDVLLRKGRMRWLPRGLGPFVPGYDLAGVLLDEAPGLAVGTRVFGMIDSHRGGACAEVVSMLPDEIAAIPNRLDFIEASGLGLAGLTALQALRDELEVPGGKHLLINGASGGVGTLAVQIGHAMGVQVTAVCSASNLDRVRELGADTVLDYRVSRAVDQRGLDAVFDVYGNLPWHKASTMLHRSGRYCTTIPRPGAVFRGTLARMGLHRASLVVVRSRRRDLEQLAKWVRRGSLRPVVDRVYSLEQAAEAHAYLETRRARGKVVLTF